MTDPWLAIVGIGEDGIDALPARARKLVERAELLVGGERHLAKVPDDGRPRLPWPRPLSDAFPTLAEHRGRPVCVLATGDPMFFGVGATLARRFSIDEMEVVPSPSAFSLAAARLGWPLAEVESLSVHGRPLGVLVPFIQPNQRLIVLTAGDEAPAEVASLLEGRGYGKSRLTVLERMGGSDERILRGVAESWPHASVDPFHTLAVECIAGECAVILPRVPGLPDDAFETDGIMTRWAVRAATLAALAPLPSQRLWDVGAGSGSVAIEWMRAQPSCRALAIERNPIRADLIARNAIGLGAPHLEVREGAAPAALADLPAPDAVFVGGGATEPGVLDACWTALPAGGRLVANAVTVESELALFAFRARRGGDLMRFGVAQVEPLGRFNAWRPKMSVTQLILVKA